MRVTCLNIGLRQRQVMAVKIVQLALDGEQFVGRGAQLVDIFQYLEVSVIVSFDVPHQVEPPFSFESEFACAFIQNIHHQSIPSGGFSLIGQSRCVCSSADHSDEVECLFAPGGIIGG